MPHPNEILFTEGAHHIFELWESLKLAVRNEWGGHESAAKKEWMLGIVVEQFRTRGKKVEVYDLEEILNQIMSDEFEAVLEDDSAYIVAKDLYKLYHQIVVGDLSFLNRLREIAQSRISATTNIVPGNPEDAIVSSDEEGNEEEE